MRSTYTEAFKESAIRKVLGPPRRSADAVAPEIGVAKSTLWKWVNSRVNMASMGQKKQKENKSIREWEPEDKLEILLKAASLDEKELGAFLRERGIYETQLKQWRAEFIHGSSGENGKRELRAQLSAERKKSKKLEREIRRKDKALAEAAALLVLQKKVRAMWADEENSTEGNND